MKKLAIIGCLIGFSACTSAQQAKVNDVRDVVECEIGVLTPYLDYFTSEQFLSALQGEQYVDILVAAGVTPKEVEATVAAVKACAKK